MKRNTKKIAVVIAIMILTLSLASTGFAKTATETLTAYYRNITIFRNGSQVNFQNEPFIVNDRTYLPVREISELLGKNVTFNPQTYRIDIADAADPNQILLQTRVIQQEVTIKNQETRIKDLEAQLEAAKKTTKSGGSKSSISNLSDLEDYLNDKYSPEDKIDFIIELSGTKNNVTLEIYVDDRTSSDRFYDWTSSDKRSYAEELVDEIVDEFDPNNISGFYRDEYDGTGKQNFTVSSKGKVTMGSSSSSGSDSSTLGRLEDDLNRYYGYKDNVDFDIRVSGTTRRIELSIDAINDDLDDLSNTKKRDYLEEIYDFIEEEISFTSIEGRIFDGRVEYDFDYTAGGSVTLTKR